MSSATPIETDWSVLAVIGLGLLLWSLLGCLAGLAGAGR
jgi:hypothetical protein